MTDSELNARVAVIEGWEWPSVLPKHDIKQWQVPPYATEWEWCGPLIEKYGISDIYKPHHKSLDDAIRFKYRVVGPTGASGKADTLQRAICLAVIAISEEGE